ncbi:MAG TPA: EAL domain-containing protein, partial [Burkholderiales bacterium]|nr:EAL domain-containing protein [Burkholderiales bacterium]
TVAAIDRTDLSKGVIWVIQDIDQRKRAEEALQEREARIRRLVESNVIGVFFWNIDGGITDGNDAFLRMLGRDRRELVDGALNLTDLTPAQHRPVDEHALEELRTNGRCVPYEKEYVRADGMRVPVLVGSALLERSQQHGVSFVLDLTEQKRAEDRIRYLAQHDALTGLPNRILLQDRIMQAVVQARRAQHLVGVLFIDLDYFKRINDSLGHQIGDRLLQMVAGRLQRCLREGDSVARLGGDEFVISLPQLADGNDAGNIARKVLNVINRDFIVNDSELHVTCSIGISIFPTDGEDADALMRAADIAMYDSKERGRNQYQFFAPHLNEAAHARLELANRLHNALRRNELVLHYQPQVELANNTVQSVEALLRWRQPNGALVSWGEFANIAEETGLILQVGEWTLREACRQLRKWNMRNRSDMRIAVNVSPRQFRQAGFQELVAQVLAETDVPGEALELEITESVLMLQSPELIKTMEGLIALGVCLSIDDFGVGYSNLAYLRRFPIRSLKIDRSFIEGIGEDPNDTAIVTAIVAMARGLRLRVVAEGVEREEQVTFLEANGCDAVQGFYFSKPVPAEKLLDVLDGTRFRRRGA